MKRKSGNAVICDVKEILEKSEKYLAMLNGGMSEEATIESRKVR